MGLFFSIFFGIVLAIIAAYLIITKFEQTIKVFIIVIYLIGLGIFWIIPPLIIFVIIGLISLPMLILSFLIWIGFVKLLKSEKLKFLWKNL